MLNQTLRALAVFFGGLALAITADSQPAGSRPGDHGPARKATIDGPTKLAFDQAGNLFVYEASNGTPGAIREISAATQTISTLAVGCDLYNQRSDFSRCFGFPAQILFGPSGSLVLVEFTQRRLRNFDPRSKTYSLLAGNGSLDSSGDDGPATEAGIGEDWCAAMDHLGNMFVCDRAGRIRRIDSQTGIISTVASGGVRGLGEDRRSAPGLRFLTSLAVDSMGNLYAADNDSGRILRIDARSGNIEAIAGTGRSAHLGYKDDGGPAIEAGLYSPEDLTFDRDGNLLFINDANRVCRIDLKSGRISTVAGIGMFGSDGDGGPATRARIEPSGIALDRGGNLFVADWLHNVIRRVDAKTGVITTVAGNGSPRRARPSTQ